ncbi:hypothetical protein M405DRAFT_848299, partial [Rhizopogon salebrosus TDB-379]
PQATYDPEPASVPGTLPSQAAGRRYIVPGGLSQEQIQGWRKVTNAGITRAGSCERFVGQHPQGEQLTLVSASHILVPHALTEPETRLYVTSFATIARNVIEIHAVKGHLADQVLQGLTDEAVTDYGDTHAPSLDICAALHSIYTSSTLQPEDSPVPQPHRIAAQAAHLETCDWACASNLALRRFIGRLETNSDKSNSRLERGGDEGSECDEGVKEKGGDELKRTKDGIEMGKNFEWENEFSPR